MDQWIVPSREELSLAFVVSCVESAAEKVGCTGEDMFRRMDQVRLIDDYLYPCYDVLHTESREAVTDDVLTTLLWWEKEKLKNQ